MNPLRFVLKAAKILLLALLAVVGFFYILLSYMVGGR